MHRLFLLVTLLLLTGCGIADIGFAPAATPVPPTPTCEAGLPAFAQTLDPLAREWDDANKLAGQTPRMQLAGQISNLQTVRRHVQDIVTPDCGTPMKSHLLKAMDETIDGYLAFLGQKPDAQVNQHFTDAETEMKAYQTAVLTAMLPATTVPEATATP